jgi:hypothetical protein
MCGASGDVRGDVGRGVDVAASGDAGAQVCAGASGGDWPEMVHPVLGLTVREILEEVKCRPRITRIRTDEGLASQLCLTVIRRMKESNSVVAAALSLRPSAEQHRQSGDACSAGSFWHT